MRRVLPLLVASAFMALAAAQAAVPISPDHPELLQAGIDDAYRSGAGRVVIPRGAYRIPPPRQGAHLQFHSLRDFEIDATGAEWILTDRTRGGIDFTGCENVVLRGVSVRYEVPPFTQGTIVATAADGTWFDVRIDAGYPADFDNPAFFPAAPIGYLFDRDNRLWKRGAYDLYEQRIERRGAGLFRIYRQRASGPSVQPVSVGDPVAFRGSGPHNVVIAESSRMTLDGVTVYNAGTFAVLETGGDGGNRYRITVKPGPRPAGATAEPLLSSTADAFHSVNVRKGPRLEDCYFAGMADDAIAIHGTFALVMEAAGNKLLVSGGNFRAGDPLRLFDRADRPAGEATVTAVRRPADYRNLKKSGRKTLADNSRGPYYELTLNAALSAAFDDLASDPMASGSGYVLRDNAIVNHRARGMLLKAENGLVEGNTIDGSTMGGIVLTPEFWWNEAGYSRNVVIRGNTIRGVAHAPGQLGGVAIAALDETPVPGCGHQGIMVEGNRFEEIYGVNLLITSACDVTVRNNIFTRAQEGPPPPSAVVHTEGALIFVTEAAGVRFTGNQVFKAGAFQKDLVRIDPSATAEGLPQGVQSIPASLEPPEADRN